MTPRWAEEKNQLFWNRRRPQPLRATARHPTARSRGPLQPHLCRSGRGQPRRAEAAEALGNAETHRAALLRALTEASAAPRAAPHQRLRSRAVKRAAGPGCSRTRSAGPRSAPGARSAADVGSMRQLWLTGERRRGPARGGGSGAALAAEADKSLGKAKCRLRQLCGPAQATACAAAGC